MHLLNDMTCGYYEGLPLDYLILLYGRKYVQLFVQSQLYNHKDVNKFKLTLQFNKTCFFNTGVIGIG